MLFLVEMFSWILPILAVLVLLIVIATGYVKAPPDQAYIISGLKKEARDRKAILVLVICGLDSLFKLLSRHFYGQLCHVLF